MYGAVFGSFFRLKVSLLPAFFFFYKTKSKVFQIFGSILIKADNTVIDAVKERKGRVWQLEGRLGKILSFFEGSSPTGGFQCSGYWH